MTSSSDKENEAGGTISITPELPLATKQHPKLYFDNALIVIQVDDLLFNVHKYQLLKSKIFSDMFKDSSRDPAEGTCPENPIIMEGVAASDFESLLTVLYATRFSTHHPEPKASLIIPAFRLAHMWSFEDLQTYLLPLAEKELDNVDKIVFAREFAITEWLAPAHVGLCQRKEPITTDEAFRLGIHSILLISLMREEYPLAVPGANGSGR
ncbi:hypothetical protein FRC07_005076, partial [Ceratobasidium sp. 392]